MRKYLAFASLALLAGCGGNDADINGDGKISPEERASEMASDGYMAMEAGRWKLQFDFTSVDVPRLGNKEKQDIMRRASKEASGYSCLSAEQAAKPGADFFGGRGAENCIYSRFDVAGDKARMTVTCGMKGMGKIEMDLDGTVGAKEIAYNSELRMSLPVAGTVKFGGRLTGVHEGPCRGDE